jgi:hypothetical protein
MKQVSVLPTFAQVLEAVAEARKKYADQIRAARAEGGKTQGSKTFVSDICSRYQFPGPDKATFGLRRRTFLSYRGNKEQE